MTTEPERNVRQSATARLRQNYREALCPGYRIRSDPDRDVTIQCDSHFRQRNRVDVEAGTGTAPIRFPVQDPGSGTTAEVRGGPALDTGHQYKSRAGRRNKQSESRHQGRQIGRGSAKRAGCSRTRAGGPGLPREGRRGHGFSVGWTGMPFSVVVESSDQGSSSGSQVSLPIDQSQIHRAFKQPPFAVVPEIDQAISISMSQQLEKSGVHLLRQFFLHH